VKRKTPRKKRLTPSQRMTAEGARLIIYLNNRGLTPRQSFEALTFAFMVMARTNGIAQAAAMVDQLAPVFDAMITDVHARATGKNVVKFPKRRKIRK
jgi:hypothetical protein